MFFDYCLSLLPEGNSKNKFSILNPCNLFLFEKKYDIIFYMYISILSVKRLENMIHIYFYLVY
jgi:hypothetical protein